MKLVCFFQYENYIKLFCFLNYYKDLVTYEIQIAFAGPPQEIRPTRPWYDCIEFSGRWYVKNISVSSVLGQNQKPGCFGRRL
jgi:hypothetical protein